MRRATCTNECVVRLCTILLVRLVCSRWARNLTIIGIKRARAPHRWIERVIQAGRRAQKVARRPRPRRRWARCRRSRVEPSVPSVAAAPPPHATTTIAAEGWRRAVAARCGSSPGRAPQTSGRTGGGCAARRLADRHRRCPGSSEVAAFDDRQLALRLGGRDPRCEHLADVERRHAPAATIGHGEAVARHHHAERAGGCDRVGTGLDDLAGALCIDPCSARLLPSTSGRHRLRSRMSGGPTAPFP